VALYPTLIAIEAQRHRAADRRGARGAHPFALAWPQGVAQALDQLLASAPAPFSFC
jgi:hypothetical protein